MTQDYVAGLSQPLDMIEIKFPTVVSRHPYFLGDIFFWPTNQSVLPNAVSFSPICSQSRSQ